MNPLSSLPIPPEVIDSTKTFTRVTYFLIDNPEPQIFNSTHIIDRKVFFPLLPKKGLVSFYSETVKATQTFTKGKPTNKEKEEVSDRSKTYIAENGFK